MPTQQKDSQRSRFYARIGTGGWRDSGYDTFAYRSAAFRRWMRSQLPAGEMAILSVGCGAGELERELSAADRAVIGLDLSLAMLRRAARNGLCLPVQADAALLPFGSRRFDAVMFVESIGYLDLDAVFKEARRVLKAEGRLIVTSYPAHVDAHARYRKWPADQVIACMTAAGFIVDRRQYLTVAKNRIAEARSPGRSMLFCLSSTGRGLDAGRDLERERTLERAKPPGAH
ncbi:MAG: class I SAM-dependent methyltransferase [Stellaceae bacterium]